jgi:predicted permease
MTTLLEDVRFALRTLRLNPVFASVAALSLALGIGANTAIFSLIDAVLLRALPVHEPDRLVFLSDPGSSGVSIGIEDGTRSLFTYEEFEHLREGARSVAALCAAESNPARFQVRVEGGGSEEVRAKLVTHDYFKVLGVAPALGRGFTPQEDASPGAGPVAVLAHEFWQTRYGGDAGVLGRSIQINRLALTIVGVLPAGFHGEVVGDAPGVFVPMSMQPQLKPGRFWLRDDSSRAERVMWLHVIGRLQPGIAVARAQSSIDVTFRRDLEARASGIADPDRRRQLMNQRIELKPGSRGGSGLRNRFAEPLVVLMAMVGLVLLVACANVANLLLARATARQKEIGLRLALGASRRRLVRQLLTESLVLSLIGGALGVLIAYWSAGLLVRLASSGPSPIPLELRPDARLLAFTAALSLLTGVVFGLVPALRATRVNLNTTLKDSAASVSAVGSRFSLGKALVVAQVAMSVLLLIGATLFVRTLANLQAADLGYNREGLLIIRVDPVSAGYSGPARAALYRRLLESLKTVPSVRGVALSENGFFSGTESGDQVTVEGYRSAKEEDNSAAFDQVGPDYFGAVGIPILLGRGIGVQDTETSPRVCVVNEAFAKFYFGKASPIGKHVRDEFPDTRETFEIVGVSRDARDHRVREDVRRRFYIPIFHGLGDIPPSAYYTIRASSDPDGLLPAVRRKVQEIDESLPIVNSTTVSTLVDRSITRERLIARLSSVFGVLALVLAAVGLYGVLSYAIARRTREIGIRMALGAAGGRVQRGVIRETLALVGVGLAIGVPGALACGRLVQSALFGLQPSDPGSVGVAVLVIVGVGLLAGYLPARRASRVDPLVALRWE